MCALSDFQVNISLGSNKQVEEGNLHKAWFMPFTGLRDDRKLTMTIYEMPEPIIIPKPKKETLLKEDLIFISKGKAQFSFRMNKESEIKNIIVKEISDKYNITPAAKDAATIISLKLGNECPNFVPDKPEAYAIKVDENVITLAGRDKSGLYWAWQSLRQLIGGKTEKVIHSRNIIDWPDYSVRSFATYNLDVMKANMESKANLGAFPWWLLRYGQWRNPPKSRIDDIIEMTKYSVARGCDVLFWISPFQNKEPYVVSTDKDADLLMKLFDVAGELGCRHFFPSIDDDGRPAESFAPEDRKVYKNDKLLAQAWFIKKISDRLYAKYSDAKVYSLTSLYYGTEGITDYYDRIGISKKLIITWPGVSTVTYDFTKQDIDSYVKGIDGRHFLHNDNTMGQAHATGRKLTICETYGAGFKEVYKSGKCVGMEVMGSISRTEMAKIRATSAAELMWNVSRYNAEEARQRSIVRYAGSQTALVPIMEFAKEFLKIANLYPVEKRLPERKTSDYVINKWPVIGHNTFTPKELGSFYMGVPAI